MIQVASKSNSILLFLVLFATSFFAFVPTTIAQENQADQDPIELYNKGQSAHEKGDFIEAIKLYDAALKLAPEFPEAEYQRGNAFVSLGRESDAEKSFKRAIELRPGWVISLLSLGELFAKNSRFAEAVPLLEKVIELDANSSSAYLTLSEIKLRQKADTPALQEWLKRLQNVAISDSAIWAARGAIQRRLGEIPSATLSIEKSLSFDGKNPFALAERVQLYLVEKKTEQAVSIARRLLTLNPRSFDAKLLLIRALSDNGKSSEAFELIDSMDGGNPEVSKVRGEVIAKSTSDIPALEKQLGSDANNPIILGKLCALTRTNPAKSLEYCRRASEADPANVVPAIGFGAALIQAKQFESAASLLQKLIQFDPDNFTIHTNLATALFELKRYSEAKSEYQWIIAKQPELAIAYYFLAIAHDNLAEYPQALTNYQRFLQLADAKQNQLEIDKIQLRLPILEKQIKNGEGSKKGKKNEKR